MRCGVVIVNADEQRTGYPPPPPPATLAALLDRVAPLETAPLCPELRVFHGRSLTEVWEAAEALAGRPLPAPFWAYPWAGGAALARIVLDDAPSMRGRRVLDIGTGGGLVALAAARAGAREVVANDIDPWALAVAALAAARNGLTLSPLLADLTAAPERVTGFDVVLCGDLAYERSVAPAIREVLRRARSAGARVLVADAGRAYFDASGVRLVASYAVRVPADLEGVGERVARVYELE